jgi:hypothetical protein
MSIKHSEQFKQWRHIWSVGMRCTAMQVTAHGFRIWLTPPMSSRQGGDMKGLAHTGKQYGLSLGRYGRPRMPPTGFWVAYRGWARCGRTSRWSADEDQWHQPRSAGRAQGCQEQQPQPRDRRQRAGR